MLWGRAHQDFVTRTDTRRRRGELGHRGALVTATPLAAAKVVERSSNSGSPYPTSPRFAAAQRREKRTLCLPRRDPVRGRNYLLSDIDLIEFVAEERPLFDTDALHILHYTRTAWMP